MGTAAVIVVILAIIAYSLYLSYDCAMFTLDLLHKQSSSIESEHIDMHNAKAAYSLMFMHIVRLACAQSRFKIPPLPKEITKNQIKRGFKKLHKLGVSMAYFNHALKRLIMVGFIVECGKNPAGKRLYAIDNAKIIIELERWGLLGRYSGLGFNPPDYGYVCRLR